MWGVMGLVMGWMGVRVRVKMGIGVGVGVGGLS